MSVEVHVVTPEREVWSGTADMVVARGVEGEVGILAGHAPLLIRLAIGPLRILHEGSQDVAVVDGGFLHVTSAGGVTRIDVLASHAEMAHEIDLRAAEFRREESRTPSAREGRRGGQSRAREGLSSHQHPRLGRASGLRAA